MAGFILGEKSQTAQVFEEDGNRAPVTFVKTNPCYLVSVNTREKNGYFSIQLGFKQAKNIAKPRMGQLTKAGIKTPLRFLREFRLEKYAGALPVEEKGKKGVSFGEIKVFAGEEVKPEVFFKPGDIVTVAGVSKGKGFQGVVRRHGFAGGPKTHGQSDRWRAPGSIGQGTTPGRVLKGKRMAGRMGGDRISVKGLRVIEVREDGLVLKGLVPGAAGGLVEIQSTQRDLSSNKLPEVKQPEAKVEPKQEEVKPEVKPEAKEEIKVVSSEPKKKEAPKVKDAKADSKENK